MGWRNAKKKAMWSRFCLTMWLVAISAATLCGWAAAQEGEAAPEGVSSAAEVDSVPDFDEAPSPEVDLPVSSGAAQNEEIEPAEVPDYFERFLPKAEADQEATGEPDDAGGRDRIVWRDAWRAFAVLMVLCGVIILGGYLARRYGRRSPLLAGHSLGRVLGTVHLNPKAALHFVETGGRVLVVGLSQGHMALIADLDPESLEAPRAAAGEAEAAPSRPAQSFLELLQAKTAEPAAKEADEDLASLRGDIQRLQHYLQESLREPLE